MKVVGLSTTNSPESISPYSDMVIPDYDSTTLSDIAQL